jgi:hypothetical protein
VRSGARLVEPFRCFERLTGMWRSVLLGIVLAGVLAGCSLDGGSGAGVAGPTTGDSISVPPPPLALVVAKRVEQLRNPYNGDYLTAVTCRMKGQTAVCAGRLNGETSAPIRVKAAFSVSGEPPVRLTPLCLPADYIGPAVQSPFCPS